MQRRDNNISHSLLGLFCKHHFVCFKATSTKSCVTFKFVKKSQVTSGYQTHSRTVHHFTANGTKPPPVAHAPPRTTNAPMVGICFWFLFLTCCTSDWSLWKVHRFSVESIGLVTKQTQYCCARHLLGSF